MGGETGGEAITARRTCGCTAVGPPAREPSQRCAPGSAALLLLAAALAALPVSASTPALVWQDEFDGDALDPSHWETQLGDGCPALCGWGNGELQHYRAENASVAAGLLTLTARAESYLGADYTSARLRSKGLASFRYGRLELRARMPLGQGLWPAFWLLPEEESYGGWAASGEIDVVEYLGHQSDTALGAIHYGAPWPGNLSSSHAHVLPAGSFATDFHDFALEWERCEMRWYVDGELVASESDWSSSGGVYPAPFDQSFRLLLNLAVGGNLPGPPDQTTVFPQSLEVDHVRVYQQPDFPTCTLLFDDMEHADPLANGWFAFGGSVGGGGIGADTASATPRAGCRASLAAGFGSGGTPGFFGGFGRRRPSDLREMTHMSFWILPTAGRATASKSTCRTTTTATMRFRCCPMAPTTSSSTWCRSVRTVPT